MRFGECYDLKWVAFFFPKSKHLASSTRENPKGSASFASIGFSIDLFCAFVMRSSDCTSSEHSLFVCYFHSTISHGFGFS
jgi:hypothetical protein